MALRMHPRYEAAFREATNKPTKMDTVSFDHFICKRCGRSRPIKGRKFLGWKQGYKCADCASPVANSSPDVVGSSPVDEVTHARSGEQV